MRTTKTMIRRVSTQVDLSLLWSDCEDAQVDFGLPWAHISEGTFSHILTLRHIYPKYLDTMAQLFKANDIVS